MRFRSNPDEYQRQLERLTQTGDPEAALKLYALYARTDQLQPPPGLPNYPAVLRRPDLNLGPTRLILTPYANYYCGYESIGSQPIKPGTMVPYMTVELAEGENILIEDRVYRIQRLSNSSPAMAACRKASDTRDPPSWGSIFFLVLWHENHRATEEVQRQDRRVFQIALHQFLEQWEQTHPEEMRIGAQIYLQERLVELHREMIHLQRSLQSLENKIITLLIDKSQFDS